MKTFTEDSELEGLIGPLSRCFTKESAKRVLKLKANRKLQTRVDALAEKCSDGSLTAEERNEYSRYVSFTTFVALLKSKARQFLAKSNDA